jgi:hypothetical protein
VPDTTDIIMLTHNRLEHLEATVDALEARTRAPYRLTVVDNASGPEVRNWLAANRHRFHELILLAENEFLPALNQGIAATTSDPFMVTDPDLIVPDQDPCWLTRMRDTLDRHPDFGLIGIGLDQSNLPSVQEPESIDPEEIVDGEIVARPVGSVFTLIRRDALRSPYVTDWATCQSVARAGYRYGWMLDVRAYHLGWDDYKLYPGHLASKLKHGEYREVNLIERAPTLAELAIAGPVAERTRAAGVPDASVLELTWRAPAVAAAVVGPVAVERPAELPLPVADGAAGAVVLIDPPPGSGKELVADACRVATNLVLAIAPLDRFGARTAAELAPPGWTGSEEAGPSDVLLALTGSDAALADTLGVRTLDDRERWLAMFAAGAFGEGRQRLWRFVPDAPGEPPPAVALDSQRVTAWAPVAVAPKPPRRAFSERLRGRLERESRVAVELLRVRAARLRAGRAR